MRDGRVQFAAAQAVSSLVLVQLCLAQSAIVRPDVQPPQDPRLRAQAVSILEKSVQVSTPPSWTNVTIDIHFQVGVPQPGEPANGEYVLNVGSWWKLRRHEWTYGSFHMILVRNGDLFERPVMEGQSPAFQKLITDTSPIDLVRFNQQDIIRSIADGPNGTLCIGFDSVAGDRQDSGEICVNKEHGWMVSKRLGDTLTVNSNFFSFGTAFIPAHVERSVGGRTQFIFDQTVTPRSDFPADFFTVSPNTGIKAMEAACREFRRAFPIDAPQPEPIGASHSVIDVQVLGLVGPDGHVSHLKPADNLYPDLNQRAMQIVSGWTFTPATCDTRPTGWYTSFVVHFEGR